MQDNYSLLINFCNSLTTFKVGVEKSDSELGVRYVCFPKLKRIQPQEGEEICLAQKQLDNMRVVADELIPLYIDEKSENQKFIRLIANVKQRLQAALRHYEPSITEKFESIFVQPAFKRKPDHEHIVASFRSLDDLGKQPFLEAYVFTESELLEEEEHKIRLKELEKINVDEELKQDLKHRKALVHYLLYGGQQESLLRGMNYSSLSNRLWTLNFQEDNLEDIYSVNVLAFDAIDMLMDSVKQRLQLCSEIVNRLYISTKEEEKLTIRQVALLHIYQGPKITPGNKSDIAKKYNHVGKSSGDQLIGDYKKFELKEERVNRDGRVAGSLANDIKVILPLLAENKRENAEHELSILKMRKS